MENCRFLSILLSKSSSIVDESSRRQESPRVEIHRPRRKAVHIAHYPHTTHNKPMAKRQADWIDWGACAAKKLLVDDLRAGIIPPALSADDAWALYAGTDEFAAVPESQFRSKLAYHRRAVALQLEKDNFWIMWAGSDAQILLNSDFESGVIPLSTKPKDAWSLYKEMDEVKGKVCESQFKHEFSRMRSSLVLAKEKNEDWIQWQDSAAQMAMREAVESDVLHPDTQLKDVVQFFKANPVFSGVVDSQIKYEFRVIRDELQWKLKSEHWISWKGSLPSLMIMEDLTNGVIDASMLPVDAWLYYKDKPEFANVHESQFLERFKDHRKNTNSDRERSTWEMEAMEHDRRLFPERSVDRSGVLIFSAHEAQQSARTRHNSSSVKTSRMANTKQ